MALATKPKKSAFHKKRSAGHHRHNKRYVKTYFPYLPLLLLVLAVLVMPIFSTKGTVLGTTSRFSSDELLILTNQQRAEFQEPALNMNSELSAAAQSKARDMATNNYWSHTSPSGKTFESYIINSGYQYQSAGENLAYGFGSAHDVIIGWMNSPEHRNNVLNAEYQDVGFGIAQSPNYRGKGPATIVVAEYAQPAPAVANITFTVNNPAPGQVKGERIDTTKRVAVIQELTNGDAIWSVIAVSVLTGAAITYLLLRNSFRIHRAISNGEAFIVHHPWLDGAVLIMILAGYLLTRTSGFIR